MSTTPGDPTPPPSGFMRPGQQAASFEAAGTASTGPSPAHPVQPTPHGGTPGQGHGWPVQPPSQPSGAGATFGLALTGTVLGVLALVVAVAALVWPGLSFGWSAYSDLAMEQDEAIPWIESSPSVGSLGEPDADGYTATEVSAAVNDSIEDGYGVPFDCPAIPAAMASDLHGRTVACTGDDLGWLVTALVVFSDADGSFSVTVY